MKSINSCSGLLAAALCAVVLAGCNAVEDVPDEPTTVLPSANVILGGKIKDLGTRRPLVLQLNGKDACLVPVNVADPLSAKIIGECKFFGVLDQEKSAFSFSAINASIFPRMNVGDAYSITVKRQPFGKICTVQSPTGTLQATNPEIQVTCVDDPGVTHYTVSVNTSAVAARTGLRVTLTTENGTCSINATGLPSPVTFTPDKCRDDGAYHNNATYIFNNGLNLPHFQWQVRTTIPGATASDPRKNCFMTGGPVANTGGNTNDNATSLTDLGEVDLANRPAGNVTVTVSACGFTVTSQADYSRNFVPAVTGITTGSTTGGFTEPTITGGDGVVLALRSQPWLVDVAAAKVTLFTSTLTAFMVPDSAGAPTGTPYDAQSDANAFYEVVVKQPPAGMACVPGYSTTTGNQSTRTAGTTADAGAVLLRRPSSATVAQAWLVSRVIRCRNIPANTAARLRGTYGQFTKTTTTTTTGSTGVVTVGSPIVRNRNFLTFFEDGTWLLGSHSGTVGVEQGFYAYNPGAATAAPENQPTNSINFINTTDTNGASGVNSSGATRLITSIVRAAGPPKTITGLVSDGTVTGYVSAGLTVTVNNGIPQVTTAKTYTTGAAPNLATLVADINTATNPGSVVGFPVVAAVAGTEIAITGPPGGVVFIGAAATDLGLPASVAAGQTLVSTNVNARLTRTVRTVVEWILEEVNAKDPLVASIDIKDGAWVAMDWQRQPAPVEDRRRIFVYQHGLYNVMAVGVNGIANMVEACYVDEIGLTGSWTKQSTRSTAGAGTAASAGCSLRQYTIATGETLQQVLAQSTGCVSFAPLASTCLLLSATSGDFPSTVGNVIMPDFPGRWPQSQTQDATDGRPVSLVDYEVRPANSQPSDPVCPTVDKLTVWDTQHGVRKDSLNPPVPRIVLCRITAN